MGGVQYFRELGGCIFVKVDMRAVKTFWDIPPQKCMFKLFISIYNGTTVQCQCGGGGGGGNMFSRIGEGATTFFCMLEVGMKMFGIREHFTPPPLS